MTKDEELRKFMADNSLTAKLVSELLGRSEATVRIWRCKSSKRQIPDLVFDALKSKVNKS